MSESTLAVSKTEVDALLGSYLGYTRTSTNWSTEDQSVIDQCRDAGLVRFYNEYDWTFIAPSTTITFWPTVTGTITGQAVYSSPSSTITASAAKFFPSMVGHSITYDDSSTDYVITAYTSSTVIVVTGDSSSEKSGDTFTITATNDGDFRLPDDFGSLRDTLHFEENLGYAPLNIVSVAEVRRRITASSSTGVPMYAAIDPVANSGSTGQRINLICAPPPSSEFTMYYRYNVLKNALATSYTYPAGGAAHRNTLIEACLAEAEVFENDAAGIHEQKYQQALVRSKRIDGKNGPRNLGPMYDASVRKRYWSNGSTHTYDGSVPT